MATQRFGLDIAAFCKKTGLKYDTVMRKVCLDGLRKCILKSPVDTGRFKGNWRVGVNAKDTTYNEKQFDKNGSATIAEGLSRLTPVKFGDTVFINNTVPYSEALENGHSGQAPQGILMMSAKEVVAELRSTIQQVKNA
jgi:hypothetical protein